MGGVPECGAEALHCILSSTEHAAVDTKISKRLMLVTGLQTAPKCLIRSHDPDRCREGELDPSVPAPHGMTVPQRADSPAQ